MRVLLSLSTTAACCFMVASLRLPVRADDPKPENLKAKDVLDRVAKTYADCKTYRDSGVIKTVLILADGVKHTEERSFATAFVRPDRFRFEYKLGEAHYIVWRNKKDVRTWWDLKPGVEKPESLSQAVTLATGVSMGSAHAVPAQLMPADVEGRRLTEILADGKRIADAKLDKVDCFRVTAVVLKVEKDEDNMTVWIDKKTFLVRRIDEQMKFANSDRIEQTATYDPMIDREIPAPALEFNAPKQK